MKFRTILLALVFGLLVLLVLPFIFIRANQIYNLPILLSPLSRLLGVILLLLGSAIWLYCVGVFNLIGKGTPVPIDPPKKLVTMGIYRFTRNPMYISALIVFLGYFFVFGHLALLFYVFLLFLLFHLFIFLYEEPTLKRKFGKSYADYCKKVPRWL